MPVEQTPLSPAQRAWLAAGPNPNCPYCRERGDPDTVHYFVRFERTVAVSSVAYYDLFSGVRPAGDRITRADVDRADAEEENPAEEALKKLASGYACTGCANEVAETHAMRTAPCDDHCGCGWRLDLDSLEALEFSFRGREGAGRAQVPSEARSRAASPVRENQDAFLESFIGRPVDHPLGAGVFERLGGAPPAEAVRFSDGTGVGIRLEFQGNVVYAVDPGPPLGEWHTFPALTDSEGKLLGVLQFSALVVDPAKILNNPKDGGT